MASFRERRQMARVIDRTRAQIGTLDPPPKGWIAALRLALGMSADHVARRKGVSRNAVYQAERSEQEGGVSLKQMAALAEAMDAKFVYAIVPNGPIEEVKYRQALRHAQAELAQLPQAAQWPTDERQDWVDDRAAELLQDMPMDFWDTP